MVQIQPRLKTNDDKFANEFDGTNPATKVKTTDDNFANKIDDTNPGGKAFGSWQIGMRELVSSKL